MLDAADEAITFIGNRTRADLDDDHMLSFAVVRAIEIIGEAANSISSETRGACPDLPWPSIIGMRHRIVHAYFDIDLDRVWETLTDDLPVLIQRLRTVLQVD
jgi:uncharacterized protein with HEPN domain